MKSLIIIAHGSRRSKSNEEVAELANTVAQKAQDKFDEVQCAFLEIAEPSIPDCINSCVERGATHIVIMPYFLAAGRHVIEDIPHEVSLAQCDLEKIKIEIRPHVGAAKNMADTLLCMSS